MSDESQIASFFTVAILSLISGVIFGLCYGFNSVQFTSMAIAYAINSLWVFYWSKDCNESENSDYWVLLWYLILGLPGAILWILNVRVFQPIKNKKYLVWFDRRNIKMKQKKLGSHNLILKINKDIGNLYDINKELQLKKLVYADESIENHVSITKSIKKEISENLKLVKILETKKENVYEGIKSTIQMPDISIIEKSKREREKVEDSTLTEIRMNNEAMKEYQEVSNQ